MRKKELLKNLDELNNSLRNRLSEHDVVKCVRASRDER